MRLVEQKIEFATNLGDKWGWIFDCSPLAHDRHERLRIPTLNWWAKDRIAEAEEVAKRLEIALSTKWVFIQYPEWMGYELTLWGQFSSDDRAVAFQLAWEPESTLLRV